MMRISSLLWHGLQVFTATLLVAGCASAFLEQAHDLRFWQDVAGAAIVATLTELLTYASARVAAAYNGHRAPAPEEPAAPASPDPPTEALTRPL